MLSVMRSCKLQIQYFSIGGIIVRLQTSVTWRFIEDAQVYIVEVCRERNVCFKSSLVVDNAKSICHLAFLLVFSVQ